MAGTTKNYGDGAAWKRGSMIGKGGFGSVYLATLKNNKNKNKLGFPSVMAVKSSEVSVSSTLQKEREIMADLKGSPYLIELFGDETTSSKDGTFLAYNLLLEYCSGGMLTERIRKFRGDDKGLPESEVRVYTRCILGGLARLHEAGYVHCNIKPDNILLVPQANDSFGAKICDFGLAKREIRNFKKRRIMREYWQGTPMYLSPEAVKDNIQEAPSDIWALGCTVLKMLTGKPVWEGNTSEEIMKKIGAEGEYPNIPDYLSDDAMDFIGRCLFKNYSYRPTAQMLFDHPFLDDLDEDEDEDEDSDFQDSSVTVDKPWATFEDDSFDDSCWFDKAVDYYLFSI
ncbi:hypothetical protein ACP275_12G055500 [Erythranthe tilingii]